MTTPIGAVVTTDATPTKLSAFAFSPSDLAGHTRGLAFFELVVVAQSDSGTSAAYVVRGCVRSVAGVLALVGTPSVTSFEDAGASTWSVSFDAGASEFRLWATGAAGTRITWEMPRCEPSIPGGPRGYGYNWNRILGPNG